MPTPVMDVAASLEAAAVAYRAIAEENEALRAELDRLRSSAGGGGDCRAAPAAALPSPSRDASFASTPKSSSGKWGASAGSAGATTCLQVEIPRSTSSFSAPQSPWQTSCGVIEPVDAEGRLLRRVFTVDEHRLINEKRNEARARLQRLLADLDPDAQGAWATQPLTTASCVEALQSHGTGDVAEEIVREIVETLSSYILARDARAVPTKAKLIDLTTVAQIRGIFGAHRVEDVMHLQDAVMREIETDVTCENMVLRNSISDRVAHQCCQFFMKIVRPHSRFAAVERIGIGLVIVNTAVLGISTDQAKTWAGWDWISAAFAICFLAELMLRIHAVGGLRRFFLKAGHHLWWNIFDTVLMLLALVDFAILIAVVTEKIDPDSSTQSVKLVRFLRLLRLSRIARIAKTGVFHELTFMIRGVEAGASTLFWALILLLLVCYVGAVFLTQTIGRELDPLFKPYADSHFANVTDSMFTIFRCINGDCASFDGKPLSSILMARYGHLVKIVYGLTVIVMSFGLLNIMVACFLQSCMRAQTLNDHERRRMLIKERKMVQRKTAALFNRVRALYAQATRKSWYGDSNAGEALADMRISREMFAEFLRDREIQRWLDDMGCEDGLRRKLFDKIDRDGDGCLECSELVTGIVDLARGRFDSMEVLTVLVRDVSHRLRELEARLVQRDRSAASPSSATTI